jgi:hypothetical protein
VKPWSRMNRLVVLLLTSSLAISAAAAPPSKDKDKAKPEAPKYVDSGAFGILVRGRRVATETFSIEQKNGTSVIKSQFKETDGSDAASQKSELEIGSSGDLQRYEWSQAAGGSITVMPSNDFLLERITTAAYSKPAEQSFLLPASSPVLDNNFFIHREVLIWRYLAADCKSEGGSLKCQQEPAQFGVLIPQDRTSMSVRLELVGNDKVTIGGAEHNLLRLKLTGENFEWSLWVDPQDQFKLMRVAIPADNTEVVRD